MGNAAVLVKSLIAFLLYGLIMWALASFKVLSSTGILYQTTQPLAGILVAVFVYLIILKLGTLFFQRVARKASGGLSMAWAFLLIAPLTYVADRTGYVWPQSFFYVVGGMALLVVWIALSYPVHLLLLRWGTSVAARYPANRKAELLIPVFRQILTALWTFFIIVALSYILENTGSAPRRTALYVAGTVGVFAVWLILVYVGYYYFGRFTPKVSQVLTTTWSIIILIFVWQLGVRVLEIPQFLVPAPTEVAKEMVAKGGLLGTHINTTLLETIVGFAVGIVVGILSAILIVWFKFLEDVLFPLLVILQIVPKIAIAPLLLIWVGYGATSKILIAFLIGYFPIVVSMISGLRLVEPELLDLVRSLRATNWQILAKIRFPNSLPFLFNGLKISITLAIIGAIVGEFVGGSQGLGYLIIVSNYELNTPLMFTSLFMLSIMGLILYGLVARLERVMIPWAVPEEGEVQIIGA